MPKDYIKTYDENAERRYISPQNIEVRNEGNSNIISGIAAVVNSTTNLGWISERIAPGAFDSVLENDVVALFNHDPNIPLARTTAKGDAKLQLSIDSEGNLAYRFKVTNTAGKELLENIRSEIITKSSFAFTIEDEEWNKEGDLRTIKKIKRLYDVSPVTYPAYNDTSVAERSWKQAFDPGELRRDEYERDRDLRVLL